MGQVLRVGGERFALVRRGASDADYARLCCEAALHAHDRGLNEGWVAIRARAHNRNSAPSGAAKIPMTDDQLPAHPRALEMITTLDLVPHPEGGHFHEIHRSAAVVDPTDGRPLRSALTVIHFLLSAGEVSRWHRVSSEEVWHHLEGDPLELQIADPLFESTATIILGPHDSTMAPIHVVPAGWWQAARSTGAYTLVGCTVAPGFEYADFEMLRDLPIDVERLESNYPALINFL